MLTEIERSIKPEDCYAVVNNENWIMSEECKVNKMLSKTTSQKTKGRGAALGVLSFAALAGLSLLGIQANAQGINEHSSTSLSSGEDVLNGVEVKQNTTSILGERDFFANTIDRVRVNAQQGVITGAAASIPVLTDGIYTVTETTYSDAPNVFKYVANDGSHTQVSVWYGIC